MSCVVQLGLGTDPSTAANNHICQIFNGCRKSAGK